MNPEEARRVMKVMVEGGVVYETEIVELAAWLLKMINPFRLFRMRGIDGVREASSKQRVQSDEPEAWEGGVGGSD